MHRLLFRVALVVVFAAAPLCAAAQTTVQPDGSAIPTTEVPGLDRPGDASGASRTLGEPDDAALYYVAGGATMLYNRPDSTAPVRQLDLRTPLHRQTCSGNWCRVRTDDGRNGFVHVSAMSNVWIRVSKADRRLYMYRGTRQVKVIKADFGYNAFLDKERRGSRRLRDHYRTPEGQFYVVRKNPNSQFYKAFVLNYPTADDAARGLKRGLISRAEHNAIVRAHNEHQMPPMNTELGGWVEIHGDGTGAASNWTQGCVAVHNRDMNALWWWVKVGTPVLIE